MVGPCKKTPNCTSEVVGTCELASPGDPNNGYYCRPVPTIECPFNTSTALLTNNSYSFSISLSTHFYETRDNFLRATKARAKFIDDYYYAGHIIGDDMDLSLALSAYDIYQSNIPRKFSKISDPSYADTIIINSAEKTLLLDFCNDVEGYSSDTRFQSIIDTVRANVNRYYNKNADYIKTHF